MPIPTIPVERIADEYVRKAAELILAFFRGNTPLLDFKHFELSFDANIASFEYPHSLGYLPKDVLVTSTTGGSVVFLYDSFDASKIVLTVTGITAGTPCKVRFFLGTYNSAP